MAKQVITTIAKDVLFAERMKRVNDLLHTRTVQNLARRLGLDPTSVAKQMKRFKDLAQIKKAATNPSTLRGVGKYVGKVGWWGYVTAVGIDILSDWYALDNVIGGAKFRIQNMVWSVRNGEITAEEALEQIYGTPDIHVDPLGSMEVIAIAEGQVRRSGKWNPFVWASKRLWTAGIEADKQAIQDSINSINFIAEEQKAFKESGRGEFEGTEFRNEQERAEFFEQGALSGISQSVITDPEERKAVMLEKAAAKEREEAELEKQRNQPRQRGVSSPRTERSVGPRPQARSKLGFGI